MATRRLRSVVLTQVAPPHPPLAAADADASPRDPPGSEHYQGVLRLPGGPGGRAGSPAAPPGARALPGGRRHARAVIMSVSCGDVAWLARGGWPRAERDWRGPERAETLLTKRALITGITGQDGSYLTEHLHAQGYEVWGLIR